MYRAPSPPERSRSSPLMVTTSWSIWSCALTLDRRLHQVGVGVVHGPRLFFLLTYVSRELLLEVEELDEPGYNIVQNLLLIDVDKLFFFFAAGLAGVAAFAGAGLKNCTSLAKKPLASLPIAMTSSAVCLTWMNWVFASRYRSHPAWICLTSPAARRHSDMGSTSLQPQDFLYKISSHIWPKQHG